MLGKKPSKLSNAARNLARVAPQGIEKSSSEKLDRRIAIWQSPLTMPLWVKVWSLILGSANVASLTFLWQPSGVLVAVPVFDLNDLRLWLSGDRVVSA